MVRFSIFRFVSLFLLSVVLFSCSQNSNSRITIKGVADSGDSSANGIIYKIIESSTKRVYSCELRQLLHGETTQNIVVSGKPKPGANNETILEECQLDN